MKKFVIFFIILLMPLVFAGSYQYSIENDGVFVKISMDSTAVVSVPYDNKNLEIDSSYSKNDDLIYLNDGGTVEYFSKSFIEKDGGSGFFIAKDEFLIGNYIEVVLPEGSSVFDKYIIYPKNYDISSDGKNIIIKWTESQDSEIFVPYKINKNLSWIYWAAILSFLIFLFFLWEKKKDKVNLSKNLFREEKDIVKYLLNKKNNSCWTKEIARDLSISKVKLSRKIRRLEEKNIIKREPHGNENRIILKK